MSLELETRIKLAAENYDEYLIKRLTDADKMLDDAIDWVMCDCTMCRGHREWMHGQQTHTPVVSRGLLRLVGLSLMVAAVVLTVVLWR